MRRSAPRSRPASSQDGGERTDTVVLACTHYPLLLDRFERLAPWPVRWIDPAPAIARRVVDLVGPSAGRNAAEPAPAFFTSGRAPSTDLCRRAHALRIEVRAPAVSA